jgi:hypothetical protein
MASSPPLRWWTTTDKGHPPPHLSLAAAQESLHVVPQVTFWKPRLRHLKDQLTNGRRAMLIASLILAQFAVSGAILAVISLLDRS